MTSDVSGRAGRRLSGRSISSAVWRSTSPEPRRKRRRLPWNGGFRRGQPRSSAAGIRGSRCRQRRRVAHGVDRRPRARAAIRRSAPANRGQGRRPRLSLPSVRDLSLQPSRSRRCTSASTLTDSSSSTRATGTSPRPVARTPTPTSRCTASETGGSGRSRNSTTRCWWSALAPRSSRSVLHSSKLMAASVPVPVHRELRAALRIRCDGRLRDIEETGFSRIDRRG